MTIDFQDAKDVEVTSFRIAGTYSGNMEGSPRCISAKIINELSKRTAEEGFYFHLTEDQLVVNEKPNEVLKPYCYTLSLHLESNYSHLTIMWFDDAPNLKVSLEEIIHPHTRLVNYHDYARVIDLDNF